MVRLEITSFSDTLSLDEFHSKNEEVNTFLKERARIEIKDNLTTIYVVLIEERVVAYVAIMCCHYRFKPSGYTTEFRVPGLLIGQLGVDEQYERKSLGSMLIDYCISIATEIKKLAGCRIIYVDSFDDAVEFYRKHNFVLIDDNIKDRNKMILDLQISSEYSTNSS